MTDQEAMRLLKDMIAAGTGISGHRVGNGADYYQCSCCGATKDTMGHADGIGELADVDHRPGCNLVKLATWLDQRFPEEE